MVLFELNLLDMLILKNKLPILISQMNHYNMMHELKNMVLLLFHKLNIHEVFSYQIKLQEVIVIILKE